MEYLIYDEQGRQAGRADFEAQEIEGTAEPLKALLRRYKKEGVPAMMGGETDKALWDGFEQIKAGDSRFFEALGEALMRKGYRFEEVEPGD